MNGSIVAGWHRIFINEEGNPVNVLTVEAEHPDPTTGEKKRWDVTDSAFRRSPGTMKDCLGLSSEGYSRYLDSLDFLEKEQRSRRGFRKRG